MAEQDYDFGMIGLGVMGRNLLLNIADHGFSIAGLDTDVQKVIALKSEASGKVVDATTEMKDFIAMLKTPRRIMMLVPAGEPVDAVLRDALPLLQNGDVLIDGGNSHYTDTDRRIKEFKPTGIQFMGVGISGGEEGARHGPSIMPGGTADAYEKMKPIFEAIAAKVNGAPCVTHIGPGSAGHYTKMVHNGIEYGLMQMISETYDVMKRGVQLSNKEMRKVYESWSHSILSSFLMDITAKIFAKRDDVTMKGLLLDYIRDAAAQKGTGKWTSQSAMDLHIPLPVIDMAVSLRDLSAMKEQRLLVGAKIPAHRKARKEKTFLIIESLLDAAYFSAITIYAQGLHLLKVASEEMNYNIHLEEVTRIWCGGCIIRSNILETVNEVYIGEPGLSNIMTHKLISKELRQTRKAIRRVCDFAMRNHIPVPALSTSLSYFDSYRSLWLPANLIQAQRDFFGSHTYQRTDKEGTFHTKWE